MHYTQVSPVNKRASDVIAWRSIVLSLKFNFNLQQWMKYYKKEYLNIVLFIVKYLSNRQLLHLG